MFTHNRGVFLEPIVNGGLFMQFLKDKIRNQILKSALEEFSTCGFEKGSIRRIAQNSNISPGNIYRYFENKEDIFYHVVRPALDRILYIIKYEEDKDEDVVLDEALLMFGDLCKSHRKELLVLIEGSDGTEYDSYKDMVVDMVNERMKSSFLGTMPYDAQKEFILKVQVEAMITGVIYILKSSIENKILGDFIRKFMKIQLENLKERMDEIL